jgi:uncharacterized protein with HEPN domain
MGIDLEIVWEIIENSLDELEEQIQSIIERV